MIIDIFLRTYSKDIEWLQYCLKSISKFSSGFRNIIICIPEPQKGLLGHLTTEKIVTCPVYKDDYLGQQISKLNAHTYTDAEYIFFTDSDVVFTEPFCPEDFMTDGKPRIMKTHYSKVGDAICWKEVTEKILGFTVEYEFMRRNELMYKRTTLEALQNHFGGKLNDYIASQPNRHFSEYNVLGAFADKFENDKYFWMDTDKFELPKPKLKQFWSWGGIDGVKKEINELLK